MLVTFKKIFIELRFTMRMTSKQIIRLCLAQLLHQLYELFKVVLCLRKFLQIASQVKLLETYSHREIE